MASETAVEPGTSVPRQQPLRLLFYGINFWPELTGVGKYTGEMCRWLADHGHAVEVVTAPPYYPAWKVSPGYQRLGYQHEIWGDGGQVHITRCPIWVPQTLSTLRRLLHLASFALFSVPALWRQLRRRPDMVLVIAPTLFVVPAAMALARWFKVPTWIHVQDFEVDAMFSLGLGGAQGWIQRSALAVESGLLSAFDRASSITPRMVDRLQSKGVLKDHCVLLPNWVDLAAVFPLTGGNAFRRQLGLRDDEIVVLYAGNMGEKQGLELVIDAARALQGHAYLRFVLAGDGSARQRLQQSAVDIPQLAWLPLQPADRLNELLNAADVHILPQRADAADLVMPSKLTGMLASGRPVLGTAARDTQLGQVLDAVGRRVDPGDSAAITAALVDMANDRAALRELGHAGRLYAQRHLALRPIMETLLIELARFAKIGKSRSNPL